MILASFHFFVVVEQVVAALVNPFFLLSIFFLMLLFCCSFDSCVCVYAILHYSNYHKSSRKPVGYFFSIVEWEKHSVDFFFFTNLLFKKEAGLYLVLLL
jgi:hypothetical protein